MGAALLYVADGLVNIQSLAYEKAIKEGEEALTRFIVSQRNPLLSITYSTCGTEEPPIDDLIEFDEFDDEIENQEEKNKPVEKQAQK